MGNGVAPSRGRGNDALAGAIGKIAKALGTEPEKVLKRGRLVLETIFYAALLYFSLNLMPIANPDNYLKLFVVSSVTGAVISVVREQRREEQTAEGGREAPVAVRSNPYPAPWMADVSLMLSAAAWFGTLLENLAVDCWKLAAFAVGGSLGLVYLVRFAVALFGSGAPSTEGKAVDLKARRWLLGRALFAVAVSATGMAVAAASA